MSKPILPAFLSVQGATLSDEEKRLFAACNPLGVCLFAYKCENILSKEQLRQLTKQIKETIGRDDVLIAIDQEGGRVRRLCDENFAPLAAQKAITNVQNARRHAYLASADLQSCGINVNFAPVLDIEYPYTSDALRSRCFSSNPQKVATLGKAMVEEYIKNGICPCVKHLPGHGRGEADPHLQLPTVDATLKELQQDFYPFKVLADAPMGMVAHLLIKATDKNNPASQSADVIAKIIRQEIGFNGLLVCDAIMMNALKGNISQRARDVFAAGCEVICLGNADLKANYDLCNTGLVMKDESLERLQKIKNIIEKHVVFTKYTETKNKYCENLKNIVAYNHNYDATEILNRINKIRRG